MNKDDWRDSPWGRLRIYIEGRLGNPTAAHWFSTGIDMGLAIALRHPAYAAALRQATQQTLGKDAPDTNKLVDEIVNAVPVEVRQ